MLVPQIGRKRLALRPVEFVPASKVFQAQTQVRMLKDVSGWIDRKRKQKWYLSRNEVVFLDVDKAAEFIVKGYAEGELPRPVSENEIAEWRAQVTTISLGDKQHG